jgi:hypothetical protein
MAEEKKPAEAGNKSPAASAYEKEWEERVKLLDVPIKKIEGPPAFTLDFAPPRGMQFRVVSLSANYYRVDPRIERAEYPQPPISYTFNDGRVTVVAPVKDNRPALLVRAQKRVFDVVRRRDGVRIREEKPGGECVLVPRADGFDYFELDHGVAKKVLAGKINIAARVCAGFASRPEYIPQDKPLTAGMRWRIPEKLRGVELPCEIAGFADVGGRETVKIVAEKHLNNQEYQHFGVWELQREKEDDVAPKGFDYEARTKERLKLAIEKKTTMALRFVYYIDRQTGITVRSEKTWLIHYPKTPHQDQALMLISQVLEA